MAWSQHAEYLQQFCEVAVKVKGLEEYENKIMETPFPDCSI